MEAKITNKKKTKAELLKKIGPYIVQGYSNVEISDKLGMSIPTVNNYVRKLLAMFECDNRTQLAVVIATKGLTK